MINKLKYKLFFRYTLVLFCASLVIFLGGYKTYRYIAGVVIEGSLRDYLQEEIFELKNDISSHQSTPKRVAVWSSRNSLHYFSYWFQNKELIHFVQPSGNIGSDLTQKISQQEISDDVPFKIKVWDNGEIWQFLAVSKSWKDEKTNDDFRVLVLQNISPYVDSSKQYKSYGFLAVAVLCFICMFAASALALNAVKPMTEALKRQKTFISDASHEMKTPLSVLMTYAEIIEKQNGTTQATKVMKNEIKNMSALIENLLSLSKMENDKQKLSREKINPDLIIKEVTDLFSQTDQLKHNINIQLDANCFLLMDATDFRRLVTILTDNALKYTPNGKSVLIKTYMKNDKFILSVKDEGIGILNEDLPHIFERFYRADKTRSRKDGSFGLGLALAKEIVQKYKGNISAQSEIQKGSEFIVCLPCVTSLS